MFRKGILLESRLAQAFEKSFPGKKKKEQDLVKELRLSDFPSKYPYQHVGTFEHTLEAYVAKYLIALCCKRKRARLSTSVEVLASAKAPGVR